MISNVKPNTAGSVISPETSSITRAFLMYAISLLSPYRGTSVLLILINYSLMSSGKFNGLENVIVILPLNENSFILALGGYEPGAATFRGGRGTSGIVSPMVRMRSHLRGGS